MFDFKIINELYNSLSERVDFAKSILQRPLTYTEKILYSHLFETKFSTEFLRSKSYVEFSPDRVAMQDATAQMAILQFISAKMPKVAVPTTVHCDHLILAQSGAQKDLKNANKVSSEVFNFLESVSKKYGIGFWKPGAGIIHQVVLENYGYPGGMMIGTDSHTPMVNGLGVLAWGVGGIEAESVMVGQPVYMKIPSVIGVNIIGSLPKKMTATDLVLTITQKLRSYGAVSYTHLTLPTTPYV